jgi:hypothetical protein
MGLAQSLLETLGISLRSRPPASRYDLGELERIKTYAELNELEAIYKPQERGGIVVMLRKGAVIKYAGDLQEEAFAQQFAYDRGLLVPRIIYHPEPHTSVRRIIPLPDAAPYGVWFICMEEIPGTTLDKVIHQMDDAQLSSIAAQLRAFLDQMAAIRGRHLGSVSGEPYWDLFWQYGLSPGKAFNNVAEFLQYCHELLESFGTKEYADSILAPFSSYTEAETSQSTQEIMFPFTHGDLLPMNIMVDGGKITGIIDWTSAGFYPEFWGYCRMHDPNHLTPNWGKVLDLVFPGPRRQQEIAAVSKMLMDITTHLI